MLPDVGDNAQLKGVKKCESLPFSPSRRERQHLADYKAFDIKKTYDTEGLTPCTGQSCNFNVTALSCKGK